MAYVERVLAVHNLQGHFRIMHGADDVPAPKPAPDGLLLCCRELGQDASQCVYVGDSPSDGLAARAAGMKSIGQYQLQRPGTRDICHCSVGPFRIQHVLFVLDPKTCFFDFAQQCQ